MAALSWKYIPNGDHSKLQICKQFDKRKYLTSIERKGPNDSLSNAADDKKRLGAKKEQTKLQAKGTQLNEDLGKNVNFYFSREFHSRKCLQYSLKHQNGLEYAENT